MARAARHYILVRMLSIACVVAVLLHGPVAVYAQSRGTGAVPGPVQVTFHRDIAPILESRCLTCHSPSAGAPVSLRTYAEVRRRATLIRELTRTRAMPPWRPLDPAGTFTGERRLPEEELALLQRWVDEGAIEGEPGDGAEVVPRGEWDIGMPDQVVEMPTAYLLPADGTDTIRSFVIAVSGTRDRYVRALEFRPGVSNAVHHANIKVDRTGASRRLDAIDAEPGFDGSSREAQFPDGQFLGWTPGQRPLVSDDGAWLLPAGADLVVEMHMTSTGKPERVAVRIGLNFTARVPTRTPYMLRLGNQHLDIPAGDAEYVSTDEYVLPVDVDVLAIQPHAHNLARSVTGVAHLPDGQSLTLISIGDWDFRWQDVYRYARPPHLPRGTRLAMRYSYDNSERNPRNPHRPARRVTFGQTSDDEMGDLWLQLATESSGDRAALAADFDPKMLREDTAGDELLVATHLGDARLRRDLAYCYDALGRPEDALVQLEAAVTLEPDSPDGQYQLGTMLLKQRRLEAADARLRRAVALDPDWSEPYNNLGVVRLLQGDLVAASREFDEALRCDARNSEALFNRGRVLAAQGRLSDALSAFNASLDIRRDDPDVLLAAASATASTGKVAEAVRLYRETLRAAPDLVPALVDLAWILSVDDLHTPASVADAVRLAERAAWLSPDNPVVLDTVAASYFAAGRVNDAIVIAERAISAADSRGEAAAMRDIGERLRRYRAARDK